MGRYDPDRYDDLEADYLNLPNDSDDEGEAMATTPTPAQPLPSIHHDKDMLLSPPASAFDDESVVDEDDLYGGADETLYPAPGRRGSGSSTLGSPVNPQWLHSSDPPSKLNVSDGPKTMPSPAKSEDIKLPSERRTALETIQERNELLIKTGSAPKTSKSFPLLPDLLNLKQAEDEDEKILASEEGRRLNPKERRQLRNKVSARNFRVRRKGMSSVYHL
jgi:hypothetical protein